MDLSRVFFCFGLGFTYIYVMIHTQRNPDVEKTFVDHKNAGFEPATRSTNDSELCDRITLVRDVTALVVTREQTRIVPVCLLAARGPHTAGHRLGMRAYRSHSVTTVASMHSAWGPNSKRCY